jgi:hypothetical protein
MGKTTTNVTIDKSNANTWVAVGTKGLDNTVENVSTENVYFALGDTKPADSLTGHELSTMWSDEPSQREAFSAGDQCWIMNPLRTKDALIILTE